MQKMEAPSTPDRQRLSGNDEQERLLREADTRSLVTEIIGADTDFFANPINRLGLIQSQEPDEFMLLTQRVNARLRSLDPEEIRTVEAGKGGFLAMMYTPANEDKPAVFESGYQAIRDYLDNSSDSIDKKIEGVSMALEALIIWTHLYKDGNGRTARFIGRFIEAGADDVDDLVAQTAYKAKRIRKFTGRTATREGELSAADDQSLMLDDDERQALREKAKSLPGDVEGIYSDVKQLLENDTKRARFLSKSMPSKSE